MKEVEKGDLLVLRSSRQRRRSRRVEDHTRTLPEEAGALLSSPPPSSSISLPSSPPSRVPYQPLTSVCTCSSGIVVHAQPFPRLLVAHIPHVLLEKDSSISWLCPSMHVLGVAVEHQVQVVAT